MKNRSSRSLFLSFGLCGCVAYDSNRSALSGLVQSKLITKHMVFFGFSLTDGACTRETSRAQTIVLTLL